MNRHRKSIFFGFLAVVVLSGSRPGTWEASEIIDYCTKESARRKSSEMLLPYKYSGSRSKSFTLKNYSQTRSMEIDLVHNRPYKIIFNREGIPEGQKLEVYIYDKPNDKKKRYLLFSNNSEEDIVVFETKYVNDFNYSEIFVDLVIPSFPGDLSGITVKGCLVTTVGYLNETLEDKRPIKHNDQYRR
ncbi:MAG TPA: hypothetical protein DDX92_12035 [Flavobacteriales bacterium]|nr:hypothetical protein [Flavobacteriales bacterium]